MAIEFACPRCNADYTVNDRFAGASFECRNPDCRWQFTVPSKEASNSSRKSAPDRPARSASAGSRRNETTAQADCSVGQSAGPTSMNCNLDLIRGRVVGLEKTSEQYIHGRGSLSGRSALHGSYHGNNLLFPYGHSLFRESIGQVRGYGFVSGEHRLWTEYHYRTIFFVRDEHGSDHLIDIEGEHLPLLDGHQVTVVSLEDRDGEWMCCAVVNHSTSIVHWTATQDDLAKFLDIPLFRRVRTVFGSGGDMGLTTPQPVATKGSQFLLAVAICAALGLCLTGAMLTCSGLWVFGVILMMIGIVLGLPVIGLALHWFPPGIPRFVPPDFVKVPNEELAEEVEAIARYVVGLL